MQGGTNMVLGLWVQEEGENPRPPGPGVWEARVSMVPDCRTQTQAGGEARHQGRPAPRGSFSNRGERTYSVLGSVSYIVMNHNARPLRWAMMILILLIRKQAQRGEVIYLKPHS